MKQDLDTLLRHLHRRKKMPEELNQMFYQHGQAGYDFLFAQLEAESVTPLQASNIIDLLLRMRGYGDADALFRLFLRLATHRDIHIRTHAANLLMTITTYAGLPNWRRMVSATRENVDPVIREALKMGLPPSVTQEAMEFLSASNTARSCRGCPTEGSPSETTTMRYIQVRWHHAISNEPVVLYSEIDEARWETRKVELYRDGRRSYADRSESSGSTKLGEQPIPEISEIASDPQFIPQEITQAEFEEIWRNRKSDVNG